MSKRERLKKVLKKSLTEEEFNFTISHLKMKKENVLLVYKILVQGVPRSIVAKTVNTKSEQAIKKAVHKVWDKFLELQDIPEGWVSISICLPQEEAMQLKNMEIALRKKLA